MTWNHFSILSAFLVCVLATPGCNCTNDCHLLKSPLNPFAQTAQTVPPPATFSSMESYLGQTPGSFVPTTPASVFPAPTSSPAETPTQSIPSNSTPSNSITSGTVLSNAVNDQGQPVSTLAPANVLSPASDAVWSPAEVSATDHTAFQAMDAKVYSGSPSASGFQNDGSDSLVIGSSHSLTTIIDDPSTALPQ